MFYVAMGKMRNYGMRNAESEMWNQKCGMTLIGRGDKPRDRQSSFFGSSVDIRPWASTRYYRSVMELAVGVGWRGG